jgi:hypothetical protein
VRGVAARATDDPDYFFQSDRDVAARHERAAVCSPPHPTSPSKAPHHTAGVSDPGLGGGGVGGACSASTMTGARRCGCRARRWGWRATGTCCGLQPRRARWRACASRSADDAAAVGPVRGSTDRRVACAPDPHGRCPIWRGRAQGPSNVGGGAKRHTRGLGVVGQDSRRVGRRGTQGCAHGPYRAYPVVCMCV